MTRTLPRQNRHRSLANAILMAKEGDRIVCHTEERVAIARMAKERICPDLKLTFALGTPVEETPR